MKLITKEKAKEKAAKQVPKKVIKELSKLLVKGFVNNKNNIFFHRDDHIDNVTWKNLKQLIVNAGFQCHLIIYVYGNTHYEFYNIRIEK